VAQPNSIADVQLVGSLDADTQQMLADFVDVCDPIDRKPLLVIRDKATGALFVEVHVLASKLVPSATVDVPLDPDDQPEYRANREVVEDHVAFLKMKEDAKNSRAFSNIVCEFTRAFDSDRPVKVIGGQHRYEAIEEALAQGVDEYHGIKVYFGLDSEQRLDVQLISNTNIAVSTDLFDRMTETLAGPQLRSWCQEVGLLEDGEDFADRRSRGAPITVRTARTFIVNYYRGAEVDPKKFDSTETTPASIKSGAQVEEWEQLKASHQDMWNDKDLLKAGKESPSWSRPSGHSLPPRLAQDTSPDRLTLPRRR
jgi:hypothetical protein